MKWPFRRRGDDATGVLAAIYVAASAGAPMRAVSSIEAVPGLGLSGDRYASKRGFWKATDACEVTFVTEADLAQATKGKAPALRHMLEDGRHRRNLLIRGLTTKDLDGRRFRIGSAVFVYHKRRPPCGYLDRIEGKGMSRTLGRGSGACVRVVDGGIIAVGDTVELLAG
jgi:MOSC domain-containing protein YiiM